MPNDPLTAEQLEHLYATIRKVNACGYGRVTIIIMDGHVRFLEHVLSEELARPDKWERRDHLEHNH